MHRSFLNFRPVDASRQSHPEHSIHRRARPVDEEGQLDVQRKAEAVRKALGEEGRDQQRRQRPPRAGDRARKPGERPAFKRGVDGVVL